VLLSALDLKKKKKVKKVDSEKAEWALAIDYVHT